MTAAQVSTEYAVTEDGLATLGPRATRLLGLLDSTFREWGVQAGASELTVPPILPVGDLSTLDVYRNFPHLAMVAATLDPEAVTGADRDPSRFRPGDLKTARFGLPSAVCYAVYLHLRGATVQNLLRTAAGTCYRNEQRYEGLRRLGAFRMREVVAVGDPEHADAHLARFTDLITEFADRLGLNMSRQPANDPFYDAAAPQALWQSIVPVKHEFVVDGLAIASVNEHRTFFGERCKIRRTEVETPASSSCAAFGLERWISVLVDLFNGDWDAITDAVLHARTAGPNPIHHEVR